MRRNKQKTVKNLAQKITFQRGISYSANSRRIRELSRLLMYSPIIRLSRRGFSLRNVTTSFMFSGVESRPWDCKNSIPSLGRVLNFSVPACNSWKSESENCRANKKKRKKEQEKEKWRRSCKFILKKKLNSF